MDHPVFLSGDYDTNFIGQQFHPRKVKAEQDGDSRSHDREFTAAMLAVAAAAQNPGNGLASSTDQGRAAGRAGSAWKTLGRLDVLRR